MAASLRIAVWLALLFVVGMVILWLASGREILTKPAKIVDMSVRDDLFGGTNIEKREVRGPILGYYIGLDLVVAGAGLSGLCGLLIWLARRRRQRSALHVEAIRS